MFTRPAPVPQDQQARDAPPCRLRRADQSQVGHGNAGYQAAKHQQEREASPGHDQPRNLRGRHDADCQAEEVVTHGGKPGWIAVVPPGGQNRPQQSQEETESRKPARAFPSPDDWISAFVGLKVTLSIVLSRLVIPPGLDWFRYPGKVGAQPKVDQSGLEAGLEVRSLGFLSPANSGNRRPVLPDYRIARASATYSKPFTSGAPRALEPVGFVRGFQALASCLFFGRCHPRSGSICRERGFFFGQEPFLSGAFFVRSPFLAGAFLGRSLFCQESFLSGVLFGSPFWVC